ncbi:MAG: hypothetical protein FWG34_09740 [Oscillospiraceae bacterium]|nr:hypothetical protein [Oscillospiraceae bacterium]
MKKTVSFMLLFCVVFSLACVLSCANDENDKTGGHEQSADDQKKDEARDPKQQATEKIMPDLPEADYGGHEFKILVTSDPGDEVRNDFWADELTGEPINDARYMRNLYIEEKYGVKIIDIPSGWVNGNGVNLIKKASAAGDFAYDAAMTTVYDACDLAVSGLILDLRTVSHIDLSKQWWDQKANRDLAIKGKMYFTTGDISQVVNDSIYAALFNKKLARDHGLENMYELVKAGRWTYDKIAELGRMVGGDLNGDGIFDENDLYGAIIEDDTMMSVISSVGERCAKINVDGDIELALYNERTVSAVKKYTDWVFDKSSVYAYQRFAGTGDEIDINFRRMFANDQALFLMRGMETIAEMRAMETDFGILPFPKLDESQGEYYSPVGSWKAMFLSIPSVQEELDRTTIILEALAAESLYVIRPAYYDKSLIGKHARDEESVEMLDIIIESKIFDFGWYYQFGSYNNHMMDLFRRYNSDFTSMYEKNQSKAENDIKKINDRFGELAG